MKLNVQLEAEAQEKLSEFAKSRPKDFRIISKGLGRFAETGGGNIKRIRPNLYRLRIGDWRFHFWREGNDVYILDFLRRDEAYRIELIERLMRKIGAAHGKE